jgi:hypothetical protein
LSQAVAWETEGRRRPSIIVEGPDWKLEEDEKGKKVHLKKVQLVRAKRHAADTTNWGPDRAKQIQGLF